MTTGQMNASLAVVDDPLFDRHRCRDAHPERPERLEAARSALARAELTRPPRVLEPNDASDEELARVHQEAYLAQLGQVAGGWGYLDPDTYYSPESVAAARRAAGGAIRLVEELRAGRCRAGLGLLRPPGHHACAGQAMGFCLLNNIAVAAAHARAAGVGRVLVLDWDVHHGNGTQEMFYADPSVLYVSTHQFPHFPGTGRTGEVGRGEGEGYTVNVPLSAGADDGVYLGVFERIVLPIIEAYAPELVLVSAGFDAHERDALAGMRLTNTGYANMMHRLLERVPAAAAGRVGLLLEGGYDLTALQGALGAVLEVVDGGKPDEVAQTPAGLGIRHEEAIAQAEQSLRRYWKLS